MSERNRVELPPGEERRLKALDSSVLTALQSGPQTNAALSYIALDYTRCVRSLRKKGYRIDTMRTKDGLFTYTLVVGAEPEWTVIVEVTLADGTVSRQRIVVRGSNEGLVRNRAQHMATRVKILDAAAL